MRVALLHLDVSGGPEERNLTQLQYGLNLAAQAGADWVITPETAVQGYFFTQKDRPFQIPVQPSPVLQPIREAAAAYQLTLFLGCAEQDETTGNYYNSCLVIGSGGEVIGRHRKLRSPGGAEAWATQGRDVTPVACAQMKAGILVCADAYFAENAKTLKQKEAEVIIVPAAWPPGHCGGPPEHAWERCSRESGLPVWVCNQTGNQERMDLSQAQSAVLVDGTMELAYSGLQPAALLFDWDTEKKQLSSTEFTVIPV
ncbi:MAG TPA: carbon-nitrogen hydrolase family protein [Patescibacteria group bacterium]|nr:carbon-nitrogen hydrolase family protein [Patescibacteria group bacterium]